jgi:hypothetical protein
MITIFIKKKQMTTTTLTLRLQIIPIVSHACHGENKSINKPLSRFCLGTGTNMWQSKNLLM